MTFEAARDPRQTIAPTDIEALLPWYTAGTLPRRERQRVEEALCRDPALARHAELVREELAETVCLNESLGAPSARAMERLMAAIDSETPAAGRPRLPRPITGRFAAFIGGFSPRMLAAAAAVAVLAIAVQGYMLRGMFQKPAATYQVASIGHSYRGIGSFAMVRFAQDASAVEITKFLEKYQAALAGGPEPGGLYLVKLAVTTLGKNEYASILARIRQDRVVASAEPAE